MIIFIETFTLTHIHTTQPQKIFDSYSYSRELQIGGAFFWKNTIVICKLDRCSFMGLLAYSPKLLDSKPVSGLLKGDEIAWGKNVESMYKMSVYSDIRFKCEGQIIFAHKVILASRCQYFHKMFTSKSLFIISLQIN